MRAPLLVVWMAGVGGSSRLCRFLGLMVVLVSWDTGVWPEGLLDACVALISKADGDATSLGQRPLSVLPIACRIWASVRTGDSVFSAGGGRSSVEAWCSTALDLEEVLSGVADSDVHLFVADVLESFDTVDRVFWKRC